MKVSPIKNSNNKKMTENNKSNIAKNSNINNIIIIRDTQPGVSTLTPQEMAEILQSYLDNVCPSGMTRAVASMIEKHIAEGMTAAQIIDCIERTGMAPRPSPQYLRAVLKNYGTARKVDNTPAWWQQNPALNYDQRPDVPSQDDDRFMEVAHKFMSEN